MCSFIAVSPLQTLYSLRAEILPGTGEQSCHSGTLCGLEVSITRLAEPSEGEEEVEGQGETEGLRTTKLMYEGEQVGMGGRREGRGGGGA